MNAWILFGIAIIVHELGHYFSYWKISGKKPKVYFNGIALHIENRDGENNISIKNKIIIAFVGVFAGLFFVLGTGNIALIYLLGSSFDISMAYSLFLCRKEYKLSWDTLIKDIPCERCKVLSNSSPPVQTSNSTSLSPNMGDKVSATPTPTIPTESSHHANIKLNSQVLLQARQSD